MQKAVFLDKDGTLFRDVPYNIDPTKIDIMPGVIDGLKLLKDKGYLLIIVTNQSGIARGYFSLEEFKKMQQFIIGTFFREDVAIDALYFCPHHPKGTVPEFSLDCSCRKPRPGLLQQAARDHAIDLSSSWMIGDILNDIEAGNRAGCRSIMIDNGNETEWNASGLRDPFLITPSFYEAAQFILTCPSNHGGISYGHTL